MPEVKNMAKSGGTASSPGYYTRGRGGFGSDVISYAKNRLSAPQFQEFKSALAGKTSKSTQSYWREKASTFKEIIEEG